MNLDKRKLPISHFLFLYSIYLDVVYRLLDKTNTTYLNSYHMILEMSKSMSVEKEP